MHHTCRFKSQLALAICSLVFAVVQLLPDVAKATLFATESFNYTAGGKLDAGENGGSGNWNGAWTTTNMDLIAGGLSYPTGLGPATGNSVGWNTPSENIDTGTVNYSRPLVNTVGTKLFDTSVEGGTAYISFLLRKLDTDDNPNTTPPTSGEFLSIGIGTATSRAAFEFGSGENFNLRNNWNNSISGGQNSTTVSNTGSYDQTYLFVGKIITHQSSNSGQEELFLKVYPSSASSFIEPTVTTGRSGTSVSGFGASNTWTLYNNAASLTGAADALWVQLGPSAHFQLDEIRLGTTWNDVVPVPEPSSLMLLLCATLGCFRVVRKRSR